MKRLNISPCNASYFELTYITSVHVTQTCSGYRKAVYLNELVVWSGVSMELVCRRFSITAETLVNIISRSH